jgi:hypothetical protein
MNVFRWAAGPLLILVFSSCASTPVDDRPRFHEAANADVIVRFPSWDLINIIKPDTTDSGFLTLHHRDEAEQILARPGIPHNVAVVVCGCLTTDEQDAEDQRLWISIFKGLQFKRVAFLRAASSQKIDGLLLIREVELGAASLAKQD